MTVQNLKELKILLGKPKNIVITTHKGPDGDAIGSSLGLYNYFLKKSHNVQVITPNEYPVFFSEVKNNTLFLRAPKELLTPWDSNHQASLKK